MLHTFLDAEDPRMRGPTIADPVSGMQTAQGVLAGLPQRAQSGVGAHVAVTMADAFTALTMADFVMDSTTRATFSLSFVFRCSDGKVVGIQLSSIGTFRHAFLAAPERPDIAADPRFAERAGRIRNFPALVETLRPVLATRPRAEWVARRAERDVPASNVNDIAEAMADPEIVHARMFRPVADNAHGKQTLMRRALRIDGEHEDGADPPPLLGEASDAVLATIAGVSADEIATLRAQGVV